MDYNWIFFEIYPYICSPRQGHNAYKLPLCMHHFFCTRNHHYVMSKSCPASQLAANCWSSTSNVALLTQAEQSSMSTVDRGSNHCLAKGGLSIDAKNWHHTHTHTTKTTPCHNSGQSIRLWDNIFLHFPQPRLVSVQDLRLLRTPSMLSQNALLRLLSAVATCPKS